MEFKIGDRVRCIEDYGPLNIGDTGTIIYFSKGWPDIGVEWDTLTNGHNCSGHAKHRKGYFVTKSQLEIDGPQSTEQLFERLRSLLE